MNIQLYTPHPKQQLIHQSINNERYKYYVLNIGRQFGKSLLAMNQMYYWMFNNNARAPLRMAWVSPIFRQAKKVYKEMAGALPGVVDTNTSELIIRFNNTQLQFFSSELYDNIRGETFDYLVCDEFAFMAEEAWTEVLRATVLVRGKKVLLISTPKGKNHFFRLHRLDGVNPQYKSFTFSSLDNPLVNPKEIEDARGTLPDHIFRQEYMAEFIDGGGTLFSKMQFIEGATPSAVNYAGVDVGRADDYTVVTVLNENGEMIACERFRKMLWSSLVEQVANICNKHKAVTLVEANSIGDPFYEELSKKVNRCHPFMTSAKSKPEIIEALMIACNEGQIKCLPIDFLKKELEVFTWEYKPITRTVKYSAPVGFHDDSIMSLAIANECRRKQRFTGVYHIS